MWLFSSRELLERRKAANTAVRSRTTSNPIDHDEQMVLIQFYSTKIRDYCKFFKFSLKVQLTALMLFKRFYIDQSAMEHDPKLILIACLFISTKIEHEPIVLQEFLDKIPKGPQKHEMLQLELALSSGISFDYFVEHPIWPLHGYFLDLQTFHSAQDLYQPYQNAIESASDLYLTDAPLLFTASQIALACMYIHAKPEIMDPFLEHRFGTHYEFLKGIILSIIELSQVHLVVDKDVARDIAKKVQSCLDTMPKPLSSPPSDAESSSSHPNPFQ
jgi:cyclin H